ncbi:MAG: hypothetical protein AB1567_03685 [bacterium]
MRFKLPCILVLILAYTYPSCAQDYSSLGESVYSSIFYKSKSYYSTKRMKPLSQYDGLLYNRGTSTLQGGTYTPTYTTTDYLTGKRLGFGTPTVPILRPWLGQSLYKKGLYEDEKKDKSKYYFSPEVEREEEYYYYYSNIFYKGKRSQPGVKEEEVNPFLKK